MKHLCFFLLLITAVPCPGQEKGQLLVGASLDLIKSDHVDYFRKAQAGVEVNYLILNKFSIGPGIEYWSRDGLSAVAGVRWYPVEEAFIRLRGMVGGNNDISIGGGWAKPMSETMRFESMADFYFEGYLSIRAGVAVIIGKRK